MLKTRLTEVCGLTRPIVLAPLASGATSGHLASAVSEAGGLGLFGGIHAGGPEWVREQIRFTRSHTSQPFGVGFITVQIPKFAENFAVCLQERVPFLAFSFGDPTSYVAQAKAAGAKVLCQVQTLEAARLAVAAGTDVLVAPGQRGGRPHGSARHAPLPRASPRPRGHHARDRLRRHRERSGSRRGARSRR